MDNAINLELQGWNSKRDKTLEAVLEHLANHGVSGAGTAKSLLDKTPTTYNEKIKQELTELFQSYQEPLCSQDKWQEILNKRAKEVNKKENQKQLEKSWQSFEAETTRETPRVISLPASTTFPTGFSFVRDPDPIDIRPELQADTESFACEKKVQFREWGRAIAFSPVTGERMRVPLQFGNTVTLTPFQTMITKFSLTTSINMAATLKKFLKQAEYLGMSRSQLAEAIRLLVVTHKENYAFTMENLSSPREIFDQACELINTEELRTVIRTQLANYSRLPGQPIGEAFARYYTLALEKLRGDCPHLGEEKIKSRANRQTLLVLPDLIQPSTRTAYQAWLNRRKSAGEDVGKEETLKYIQEMENSSPTYMITEEKFPRGEVPIAEVSLHHTDPQELVADSFVNEYARQFTPNKRLQKGQGQQWARDPSNNNHNSRSRGRANSNSSSRGGGRGRNNNNNAGSNNKQQQQQRRSRSATPYRPNNSNNHNTNNHNSTNYNNSNSNTNYRGRGNSRGGGRGSSNRNNRNRSNDGRKSNNNKFNNNNSQKETCEKCLKGHASETCWTYPGPVMPSPCRFCENGRHNSNDCKSNSNNNKMQSAQALNQKK